MDYVSVLLPIALILFVSKTLAILCKKIGLPQVVGYLIAGLLLGLIYLIPNQTVFTDASDEGIGFLAKIGVILIMFSAGLGADLKQIKATGAKSVWITSAGVIVPMAFGFILSVLYNGGFEKIADNYLISLSYGTILTATSVSVTVAALKELGKLNSPMGTCIVSAAILDDIIGVVVLSIVLGLDASSAVGAEVKGVQALLVNAGLPLAAAAIVSIFLYFIIFIAAGIFIRKVMNYLAKKYDHHRRIPIYALAICFLYAWCAEELFGVADITGAFIAGILLSDNYDRNYIDNKAESFSNVMFTPIFFANIGMGISFSNIDPTFIGFGILFVVVGILGKFIGCGGMAKLCKFSWKESASIGVGMMVRAEVALVCVSKLSGILNPQITTFVVVLILVTSLITPILLKLLNKPGKNNPEKVESPVENKVEPEIENKEQVK